MKYATIYPMLNLDNDPWVGKKHIVLPIGSKIQVKQYFNHVFLHVHINQAQTDTSIREVILAEALMPVPSDYEYLGSFVANETTKTIEDLEKEIQDDELDMYRDGFPQTPEEFYAELVYVSVYISPERSINPRDSHSWSFIKERK